VVLGIFFAGYLEDGNPVSDQLDHLDKVKYLYEKSYKHFWLRGKISKLA